MLWTAPPPAHEGAKDMGAVRGTHDLEEPIMQAVTTIGLDVAKGWVSLGALNSRSYSPAPSPVKTRNKGPK